MSQESTVRNPKLLEALLPVVFLVALLFYNVFYVFGDDGLSGSNQIILLLSGAVAGLVGIRIGFRWEVLLDGVVNSIQSAMPSILILLLIGSLSGTWMLSGIVPSMIYYGLQILNAKIFLVAACLICALVSIATGSSWSTIATVGVALLGIGTALGLSEGLIAGAIISGAYFGDKMSPLSDTTNLAAAVAGTDLFTHIRYMTYTTIPSFVITLIIFLILGFWGISSEGVADVDFILKSIDSKFWVTPWLFLVPAVVIFMIVKKVPALPAILAGVLLGGVFAVIFQYENILAISGENSSYFKACYIAVLKAMYGSISFETNSDLINGLLSSKGMYGMLGTVWLIISAMVFGGMMEITGMLQCITSYIIKFVKSTGSLVASTVGTCLFFNFTASDQYLAIVVPGRMYAKTFKEKNLMPENLSRTLEDSGTVTSVLIPWNTCGAAQSSVLGVATAVYWPFCFFCLLSPLVTILFAIFNIKIRKIDSNK